MNKKTYSKLGPNTSYQYEYRDIDKYKKIIISNTISSLNVVGGDNNDIRNVLYKVDNIGSNVKILNDGCFEQCSNLIEVNIPTTIDEIRSNSFKDCIQLSSISDGIFYLNKKIGDSAFQNCDFKYLDLSNGFDINDDYTFGEKMFSNNNKLTDISMHNVLLTNKMFDGCEKLSSVTFDISSVSIYSDQKPFNNCINLSTVTFSENITEYDMLHEKTLKGSNILSLHMTGMSYDDVEFAIGNSKRYNYETPYDGEYIKLGTIFLKPTQDMIEKIISEHIPAILFFCRDSSCKPCQEIYKILKTMEFATWFKQKKAVILYYHTPSTSKSNYAQSHGINLGKFISYKDFRGQEITGRIGGSITLNTVIDTSGYKIGYTEDGDLSKAYKYWQDSKQKLEYKNKKFQYFSVNNNVETKINDGFMFLLDSINTYIPGYSYYWNRSDDIVNSPFLVPFEEEHINSFINGENFEITYTSQYSPSSIYGGIYRIGLKIVILQFSKINKGEYSKYFEVEINGKKVSYYLNCDVEDFIKDSYDRPLKRSSQVKMRDIFPLKICNGKMYVYIKNILLKGPFDNPGIIETDDPQTYMNPRTMDGMKKYEDNMCTNILKCDGVNGQQNTDNLIKTEIIGDCWGVEHDCTVFDNEENPHQFIYTPPSES